MSILTGRPIAPALEAAGRAAHLSRPLPTDGVRVEIARALAAGAAAAPAAISVENLTRIYGGTTALAAVSLSVVPGEILCLLGPSGSGKSTLLRLLAGLEIPSVGRIVLDGIEVAGPRTFVEPERRRVGMVFQDYALFPHLTVAENVGFGLRRPGRATVAELLAAVGLHGRENSYPHMLSGGERQRVALARALAPEPRVLLLDEPFSGLDGRLRDQIRRDTVEVLRRTRTTTILVTHDPLEALRLADRIALLDRGTLVQVGCPDELYRRPGSLGAARTFGAINLFAATCRDGRVDTVLGGFAAPASDDRGPVQVCVRPQHLRLSPRGPGVRGHVAAVTFLGDTTDVTVVTAAAHEPVVARVPGSTRFELDDEVYLTVDEADVMLLR